MKFTILATDLRRALSACNDLAPISSSIAEETTGVLIRTSGEDRVVFMASDDTSHISMAMPAKVLTKGQAVVRCAAINSSIAATFLEDDKILTVEIMAKTTLSISGVSGVKHNRTFPLLNAGFFVETPAFDRTKAIEARALDFQDGLSAVAYAASRDPSKLHFNCIAVNFTPAELIFAATDGVQIAEFRKATLTPEKGLRGSFIFGLKFANIVSKHVADGLREGKGSDLIEIYVDNERFFLQSGETILVGSLLNTSFPEYEEPLMIKGKLLATFPREDFLSVLSSIHPTVDAKSHRIIVSATKKGTATVSTSSINGEAISSDIKVNTPENFVLHFDAHFLQTSIRQLRGEDFEFYFTPKAPHVVLKSPQKDDFKALVCTLKPTN